MNKHSGERLTAQAAALAAISQADGQGEQANAQGRYTMTCVDADGNVRWSEEFDNVVCTAGKNDLLDKYLAGSTYTATFYLGLISSVSYNTVSANDTSASHTGWFEAGLANAPAYSQANRPTVTFNSAANGSKSSTATAFSITSNGTVVGAFLSTSSVKDGTSGILFSAGNLSGGNRAVITSDTLNITYTLGV